LFAAAIIASRAINEEETYIEAKMHARSAQR
jgi:hypothetical protein